ncbi:putative flavoprotein oxygenase [Cupriavidus taiwanensis]|uniref:flavin reductase family protein n=1 Tax=Cupriavidus taiwanensis TaxID=164546 RepID=UPI000E138E98|nr:flavin reductase family protein [Cupriavidus taiwanensis]SOZ14556.1 putative flavoprotein oxygenase [Cupriavidus taiwanensis]SOZ26108.1 putative flavoprotein oxygenase [Cupriavidus taiwanensis]SOZ45162.1 putative flavoprotein oxygenase [Cupriavidus taiwanensis]
MDSTSHAAPSLDPRELRRVCGRYATGVAVIGACTPQQRPVGITVNSFASLSLAPPLILWSLARHSPNAGLFGPGAPFGVSILRAGHGELARRFATPSPDKFAGVGHRCCPHGVPYLDEALATLSCRVERADPVGDHLLIVGAVEAFTAGEGEPLVFYGGDFFRLAA